MINKTKISYKKKAVPLPWRQQAKFNQENVSFNGTGYKELEQALVLFEQMNSSQVTIVNTGWADCILTIKDVVFPKLKYLCLCLNKIESIEQLCRIQTPFLKTLDLSTNNIQSISCMRKGDWSGLKELDVSFNYVKEFSSLIELDSFDIKELIVQTELEEDVFCDDIRWLVKMETENLADIRVRSMLRIEQQQAEYNLKRKHKKLTYRDQYYD